MARRRRPPEQKAFLFPFLSVLACVIGILTLMIATLALGQLKQPNRALSTAAERETETLREEEEKLEPERRTGEADRTEDLCPRESPQLR